MPQSAEAKRRGWAASVAKGICPMCATNPRSENYKWCEPCRRRQSARVKERRKRFREAGLCYLCGKRPTESGRRCTSCLEGKRKWTEANRPSANDSVKRRIAQVRLDAIEAYGGQCVCCGQSEPYFLTFDHIDNDGASHRALIGKGTRIAYWLRENGYPKDIIQILCWNCNAAKFYYGGGRCPHEETRPTE